MDKKNEIFAGIEVKQSANTDFADMDNDGAKDLIIGGYDGNFTYYKNLWSVTSVESVRDLVISDFELSQNYPNPFNPVTKIKFTVPNVGDANFASTTNLLLKVYDILGNQIATLVNEEKSPGTYEVEFDGSHLSSGIYFYELTAGKVLLTKKMLLMK